MKVKRQMAWHANSRIESGFNKNFITEILIMFLWNEPSQPSS